jgi:uncharacterized protein involved in exopolysaccharide biosynthesis
MEDDVKTLGDYISIVWRRKFYLLIPFVVVLSITIVTVFVLPPVYNSTGTILIESQQIPKELIQSTVTSFADERIQIIKQRIMTSQQLLGIIKKFNLYADKISTTARSKILEDMRDRIFIDRVSANVKNRRNRASALIAFTVSFEHRNAETAQRVANELVTLFLDENIKSRTIRAEETSDFLKKESERLGTQIEVMGERIANYKQQYEGSLPETLQLNLERVVTLKTAFFKSEADLNALNERKKLLLIDLDTLELSPDGGLPEEQQLQKQELKNLQNQYISLAARYGAEHPDVKAIKRQIAAFEDEYGNLSNVNELKIQQQKIKKEMLELTRKYSKEHPDVKRLERKLDGIAAMIAEFDQTEGALERSESNPQMLQLKAKLESVDSSIARIKKSRLQIESQIKGLDARISRTPQVERGLEALERDYGNTKRKYQEMKAKQSQAELSMSLEEEQKGERFTLLEPPLLPDVPIKPNRPKVFMLGLILSFISGIGVAGLAELLDGGIRGTRALASVTKMTPLATIPYIATHKDAALKRRNVRIFIAAVIGLVGISIVMVHFFYKPLDLLWFIILRKLNLA